MAVHMVQPSTSSFRAGTRGSRALEKKTTGTKKTKTGIHRPALLDGPPSMTHLIRCPFHLPLLLPPFPALHIFASTISRQQVPRAYQSPFQRVSGASFTSFSLPLPPNRYHPHANSSNRPPSQVSKNRPYQKRSHHLRPLRTSSISHSRTSVFATRSHPKQSGTSRPPYTVPLLASLPARSDCTHDLHANRQHLAGKGETSNLLGRPTGKGLGVFRRAPIRNLRS